MAEVLLVDDERAVREGLKALLVGEGYSVRTARDSEDARYEPAPQARKGRFADRNLPNAGYYLVG